MNIDLKCSSCNKAAEWILIDSVPYELLFEPLCEEHFREIREMEGEMNLDFVIVDETSISTLIYKANEKWKFLNDQNRRLLKLYEEAKKEEAEE